MRPVQRVFTADRLGSAFFFPLRMCSDSWRYDPKRPKSFMVAYTQQHARKPMLHMYLLLETDVCASSTDNKVLSTDNDKLLVIILVMLFCIVRTCTKKDHIEPCLALNHVECLALVPFR